MSQISNFWKEVKKQAEKQSTSPVQLGVIIAKAPLKIRYKGLEIGAEYGDTIYLNNLLLDDNINLDLATLDEAQTLDPQPWIGQDAPNANYTISGTQKQFITDFYNYFKEWQKRYIIEIGDLVAIQKLGNNTYILLQKVQKNDI